MNEIHYFAYGSNLDADQMRERCPTSRPLAAACLDGHRLDFTHYSTRWSGGAADIVREPGSVVWGVVYQMHSDDLTLLDRFEGGYARIDVRVEHSDGRRLSALSYSVRDKSAHPPDNAYIDKMLHWGAHWALPEHYLAELRRIARAD